MLQVYYDDCINGMKKDIDDESIDLIIADPPFGLGFDGKNKGNYARKSKFVVGGYQEAPDDYYKFSMEWIKQAHRVLKDTGSIYIYSG
ncbi:MAG: site-specific DNA-methyltransferase, partial [Candidatus Lokiarchaeota archaeon]|nr:site-specific DNA-methyltransferase [Candidatus Lokiarchaeota archaeon]